VEESLTRLGLDRVDVLLVHDPDDHYDAAVGSAFRALQRLRDDGSVRAIGAGMNQSEMLARFAEVVPLDCLLLAGRYTLLDQGALAALFPICMKRNIGILLGGIYNSGILANLCAGAKFNYEDADAAIVARTVELEVLCDKHGIELKAAAVQFCTAHPAVTVALQGARTAEEVADNMNADAQGDGILVLVLVKRGRLRSRRGQKSRTRELLVEMEPHDFRREREVLDGGPAGHNRKSRCRLHGRSCANAIWSTRERRCRAEREQTSARRRPRYRAKG
jgi:Aldo/keto reductase family